MKNRQGFQVFVCVLLGMVSQSAAGKGNAELINLHDPQSIQANQPILIAHRGGVVTEDAPENSWAAIELAAARGYAMVEVDIRETKDGVIVAFHDNDMMEDIGIAGTVEDFTYPELTQLRYKGTDERIITLDEYLQRSTQYKMGVMLDIKTDGTEAFFKGIADLVEKYGLTQSAVTISKHPLAQKYLKGKALLRMTKAQEKKIENGEDVDLSGTFWFDWPRYIRNETVRKIQQKGALVIPSINVFHYPPDEHMERARKDIERMKQAGVDAYQIDGVYDRFFQ